MQGRYHQGWGGSPCPQHCLHLFISGVQGVNVVAMYPVLPPGDLYSRGARIEVDSRAVPCYPGARDREVATLLAHWSMMTIYDDGLWGFVNMLGQGTKGMNVSC